MIWVRITQELLPHILSAAHTFVLTKMNFANAVKGSQQLTQCIATIKPQAELELKRKLTTEEEVLLFKRSHPSELFQQIEKVQVSNTFSKSYS